MKGGIYDQFHKRWQEEQDAEQRRKDAMKLGDEERETILQVMMMKIIMMTHKNRVSFLKFLIFPNEKASQNC